MARTPGSSADATRDNILSVARRLFVDNGYAGTSILIERAGLARVGQHGERAVRLRRGHRSSRDWCPSMRRSP
jgi:hypothetical protein